MHIWTYPKKHRSLKSDNQHSQYANRSPIISALATSVNSDVVAAMRIVSVVCGGNHFLFVLSLRASRSCIFAFL